MGIGDSVAIDRGIDGGVLVPDLLVEDTLWVVSSAVGAIRAGAGLQPITSIKPIIRVINRQMPFDPVISCLDDFDEFIGPVYPGPNRSQDSRKWRAISRVIFGQSCASSGIIAANRFDIVTTINPRLNS